MGIQVNNGGQWASATPYVNDSGTWKRCQSVLVRQAGVWHEIYSYMPPMIATSRSHTLGLKSDGTVVAAGANNSGQLNVGGWSGIASISCGSNTSFGVQIGGSVVACGSDTRGPITAATSWSNVTQIAGGYYAVFGLKGDGTAYGSPPLWIDTSTWSQIIQVEASADRYPPDGIGLRADGTIASTNMGDAAERTAVGNWSNIVQVAMGGGHTLGLKSDGTVVGAGDNGYGQINVGGWSDITQLAAGGSHSVGLKSDGTVVAAGWNTSGQTNVGGWTNIVQLTAAYAHTLGLDLYGSVVGVGANTDGQLNVSGWNLG